MAGPWAVLSEATAVVNTTRTTTGQTYDVLAGILPWFSLARQDTILSHKYNFFHPWASTTSRTFAPMKDEQTPRRLIAAALFSTETTTMMPTPYEQLVAQQYITGNLSIQQAIALLEDQGKSTKCTFSISLMPS